jgi:scyllo-inositol 2-dehydrogenase (NADP+)
MERGPVRVGILGLGRSGWNIHAGAISQHDGFEVAAVADPVGERRDEAKERFGCSAYPEPEGAIEDENVEMVVVATPSHTHVDLTIRALAAGRHVVVEKPMAQSAGEMDAMIGAAEKAGRVLTCYQPRRLDAEFVAVQGLISSGKLGRIVEIRRTSHRFARRGDWQMLRKYGGGELSNTVPHLLDQILALIGDGPTEIFADLQHTVGAGDAEDHVKLCLKTSDGVVADIESSFCAALPQPEWLIFGTSGALSGSASELQVRWFDQSGLDEVRLDEGPAPGRKYGTGENIEWQEETLRPSQTRSSALQFYDRLRSTIREDTPVLVTPQSVRRQIEIIEQAREKTGFR